MAINSDKVILDSNSNFDTSSSEHELVIGISVDDSESAIFTIIIVYTVCPNN